MPTHEQQIFGENPEDWVEGTDGVWELREDVAEKARAVLQNAGKKVEIDPALQAKEQLLLRTFDDYLATRRTIEEHPEQNWLAAKLTCAIAKRDPESAKSMAKEFAQKKKWYEAVQITNTLCDPAFTKEILALKGPHDSDTQTAFLAAEIGDTTGLKAYGEKWVTDKLFPSKNDVLELGTALAKFEPLYAKELVTRALEAKHIPRETEAFVAGTCAVLADSDPTFYKTLMEKDLAAQYGGGGYAGKIAIALKDHDAMRRAAEKYLSSWRPNDAAEVAFALNDPALKDKARTYAVQFGAKTKGEVAIILGEYEEAKAAAEECLRICEEKKRAGKYNENSTDSGESYEKKAQELMIIIARRDSTYAKSLIPRKDLPQTIKQQLTLVLAETDPEAARAAVQTLTRQVEESLRATNDHNGTYIRSELKSHAALVRATIFKYHGAEVRTSGEEAAKLVALGKDRTAMVVGWATPTTELPEVLKAAPSDGIRRSAVLGSLFNKRPADYQRELVDLAFASSDDPNFERTLSRCLSHFDYEQASNILLQKLKDSTDEKLCLRYLKTLIDIENPKGRTMATDLFANRDVPRRRRRYLAEKLIASHHWDPELGKILPERIKEHGEEAVDDILVAMISDLGLVPDVPAYTALEKPGILEGATLSDRVHELQSLRDEFSRLPLKELKERLKDDRIRRVFYLVKGGEYRYTLINRYSYEQFSLVVDKMQREEVDEEKMAEFSQAMEKGNVALDRRAEISNTLREGRMPLKDKDRRSFAFDAAIDLGSEFELANQRLQEIWGRELKALGWSSELEGELPLGIDDAIAKSEGKDVQKEKTQRILQFLKMGEKQDIRTLRKLADACKKDLVSSYKQKARAGGEAGVAAKVRLEEIERLNISGLLHAYITERLPRLKDSAVLLEWESHLRDTLTTLETGPVQGATKNKRLELTFLDKGRDFVRATRFADSRQCCFNSSNYNANGPSAADWIAKLHADPLSFIMDIREEGSRIISGFVFGRTGIDPATGRPIVMLNGIYSQESGPSLTNNILKIIEDQFARPIGAASIVIASKHGGKLAKKPDGYQEVKRDIKAIRALKNNARVYDDIGTEANDTFTFEGYERTLAA